MLEARKQQNRLIEETARPKPTQAIRSLARHRPASGGFAFKQLGLCVDRCVHSLARRDLYSKGDHRILSGLTMLEIPSGMRGLGITYSGLSGRPGNDQEGQ